MAEKVLIIVGLFALIGGALCAVANHMEHDVNDEWVMPYALPFIIMLLGASMLFIATGL